MFGEAACCSLICDIWTRLILSPVQSHITASRRALEAFLVRYPLCYGYWKKFADLERRAGYNTKAEEVKTKSLQICMLSSPEHYEVITEVLFFMNLWLRCVCVCLCVVGVCSGSPGDSSECRSVDPLHQSAAGNTGHEPA